MSLLSFFLACRLVQINAIPKTLPRNNLTLTCLQDGGFEPMSLTIPAAKHNYQLPLSKGIIALGPLAAQPTILP